MLTREGEQGFDWRAATLTTVVLCWLGIFLLILLVYPPVEKVNLGELVAEATLAIVAIFWLTAVQTLQTNRGVYVPLTAGIALFSLFTIGDLADELVEVPHVVMTAVESVPAVIGALVVTVGIYRWMVYRDERERLLTERNRRLDRFASMVSHDLRNPLGVAIGRVELARDEHDSEHLVAADRALSRMETILDALVYLARGEDNEVSGPVDVGAVARRVWDFAPDTASLDVETDLTARGDEALVSLLVENVFRNSVRHAGPDVTVTVGALPDGFYIEDDGPGIPEDQRLQAFAWGYTTDSKGNGYGLAIVQTVAKVHGWDVELLEAEGGGVRIEFSGVETV